MPPRRQRQGEPGAAWWGAQQLSPQLTDLFPAVKQTALVVRCVSGAGASRVLWVLWHCDIHCSTGHESPERLGWPVLSSGPGAAH